MPIMIGISVRPPASSALPKVKRGKPAGLSRPTEATSSPSSSETMPFSGLASAMNTALDRPSDHQPEILERGELERHLGKRRRGDDQHRGAEQAADHREHQARAERELALPFVRHRVGLVGVRGGGRRARHAQQAARNVAGEDRHRRRGDDRGDGRHRRHEERHRHQQRGRHGGGQAGHRADEQAERRRGEDHPQHIGIEHQRAGAFTKSILLEHAPGQRNAQQLVEREMDRHGGDHADQGRDAPRGAEDAQPGDHQHDAGEMEAELVGGKDVEQQARPRRWPRRRRARRRCTQAGSASQGPPLAHARDHEQRAAHDRARRRSGRETMPGRTSGPASPGTPGCARGSTRGERDERRAGQRIVDLYLASPTAFSAAPRFVSDSAMNFAVPAGSAHTMPKPGFAMKSLYSFES